MLSKTRPHSLILRLRIPRLDPADARLLGKRAGFHIRPDTRLVVAVKVRVFFVEHAVDFQDVAVAGGALELVAGAVEAEDERSLRGEGAMFVSILVWWRIVVGCCVVGFFATRAGFSRSGLPLLWLVAARFLGSVDSWLRVRSFG